MPFPIGDISVDRQSTRDETNGRDWHMPGAQNVRFLAVSGQIWIGDTPLWYDFTLVEYHVYIDEVSWLIFFSTWRSIRKRIRTSLLENPEPKP